MPKILFVFLQIIKTTNNKGCLYVPQHSSVTETVVGEKNHYFGGKKSWQGIQEKLIYLFSCYKFIKFLLGTRYC